MSRLFDLYIPIPNSPDYCRFVWVLAGLALVCLTYSALPVFLKGGFILGLLWVLWQVKTQPRPYPPLNVIHFQQGQWILTISGQELAYPKIQIGADTGFFLLLHFSGSLAHQSRWVVMFYDQLSHDQLRTMHIIKSIGDA